MNFDRYHHRLSIFVKFAVDLGSMSTCKRLKVGCIVATPTLTEILAIGYNGQPAGIPNDKCRGETPCGCIHCEANAMVKIKSDKTDLLMIVTASPCEHCAGLIINGRNVSRVVYLDQYRDLTGLELLERAGIQTEQYMEPATCRN